MTKIPYSKIIKILGIIASIIIAIFVTDYIFNTNIFNALNIISAERVPPVIPVIIGGIIAIAPRIYNRLFFEGFSIKQLDHRYVSLEKFEGFENKILNKNGEILPVFSTVLKVANAKKESILIDNIRTNPISFKINDISFKLNRIDIIFCDEETDKYLPPSNSPNRRLDNLPFIIKSDEMKNIVLGFWFRHTSKDSDYATKILAHFIEAKGLHVTIRINGKYRDYLLHIQPEQFN